MGYYNIVSLIIDVVSIITMVLCMLIGLYTRVIYPDPKALRLLVKEGML